MQTFKEKQKAELLSMKYNGNNTPEFFADVIRLENGEPFEYVLGFAEFLGCHIDLSKKPMIPRYETAFWVERAIAELKALNKPLRLADTFAGSGNVGIALLKHLPDATVDFSELDPELKEQIQISCAKNNIEASRYTIISESALNGLTGTYDAIFAVPPYVAREALPDLDPEMINYEPHLAFFADDGGSAFHKLLIETAWDKLNDGGTLYMEADMDQDENIKEMVKGTKWSKLEFWPDPYSATPNVVLRK